MRPLYSSVERLFQMLSGIAPLFTRAHVYSRIFIFRDFLLKILYILRLIEKVKGNFGWEDLQVIRVALDVIDSRLIVNLEGLLD
jgi:hypothetical protein